MSTPTKEQADLLSAINWAMWNSRLDHDPTPEEGHGVTLWNEILRLKNREKELLAALQAVREAYDGAFWCAADVLRAVTKHVLPLTEQDA